MSGQKIIDGLREAVNSEIERAAHLRGLMEAREIALNMDPYEHSPYAVIDLLDSRIQQLQKEDK